MTSSDRTADRLAILELIARYSYAWDECDTEAYVALFTDDAVFEADPEAPDGPVISCHGRDAIRAWAQPVHERRERSRMQIRHNQTGTLFEELTDASARTRTMLLTTRCGPDPEPSTSGVYSDEFRKTSDGWRFSRRTLRHDFPT